MIINLEEKYIDDTAEAHCLAWKKGFREILSDQLLDHLKPKDFSKNWREIIKRKNRINDIFIYEDKAVGFVSYGAPYDKQELAQFEIYGIYVHPDFWKQKIGYRLLQHAVNQISKENRNFEIVLWVMSDNWNSRNFYEKFGFQPSTSTRISYRSEEKFEEIKYKINQ